MDKWAIWIDTGGTFTDCLAIAPDGRTHRTKVLSSSALRGSIIDQPGPSSVRVALPSVTFPGLVDGFRFRLLGMDPGDFPKVRAFDPASGVLQLDGDPGTPLSGAFETISAEEAPTLAARIVTRTPGKSDLPPLEMRLATTRATNALLERTGGRIALFITRGFRDLLAIGTQQRPDLFDLRISTPDILAAEIIEVDERLGAAGDIIIPLDEAGLRKSASHVLDQGIDRAAVVLLNACHNPQNEERVVEILSELGFASVTSSTQLSSQVHFLDRTRTTVADAYLLPVLDHYLDSIRNSIPGDSAAGLRIMTSAGGLVERTSFHPRDSLLSGPAAGIMGASIAGRSAGIRKLITFDMGGTSTDVSRFDDSPDYAWSHEVAGIRLLAPALAIETVAAGGGSICQFQLGALNVGPQSAGAIPGPACYGSGGPLTLTDCNLLLGRLDAASFEIPVSVAAARREADRLAAGVAEATAESVDVDALLGGLIDIANDRMADAIRRISVRKGYDPAEYALLSFGGAGGQHACAIAERLDIDRVLIPMDAALLSARGLGAARMETVVEAHPQRSFHRGDDWLTSLFDRLVQQAESTLSGKFADPVELATPHCIVEARLPGQNDTLSIDYGLSLFDAFSERYLQTFGYTPIDVRSMEIASARVIARTLVSADLPASELEAESGGGQQSTTAWFGGSWQEIPLVASSQLGAGGMRGPALITADRTTVVVSAGWTVTSDEAGSLQLVRDSGEPSPIAAGMAQRPSAVVDEVFAGRFVALVEEMGDQLRRTAMSVNVKERLDFSCALLDPDGMLVINAPHIPVHLGALGLCVRRVRDELELRPGDVVVTNHPAFGGSHLPDITLVSPVHTQSGDLLGYVANRAHHAEIGGARPGSMPPDATALAEEGVVIPPTFLIRNQTARWEEIERLLRTGPFPSRLPSANIADLKAQLAANRLGALRLGQIADSAGAAEVVLHMRRLAERSAVLARNALRDLASCEAEEFLDDGSRIRVSISRDHGLTIFDFEGTSAVHRGNLNATPAIVRSAVLYVVRLLAGDNVPLNEGLLESVEIRIPTSLLSPNFPLDPEVSPAVVGGNTEVSQRLVDTLLKALGIAACSQGTMNNVLWGNDRFGYYETVGGGAGGCPGWDGAHAVHTHMTNTRITDAEVLEHRYPVRLWRFERRLGSGGMGQWNGGDGIRRETEFLEAMTLSVLSQHRIQPPYGMDGGSPGQVGRQWLERADGSRELIPGSGGCDVFPGDRLIIETPGGGAFGSTAD